MFKIEDNVLICNLEKLEGKYNELDDCGNPNGNLSLDDDFKSEVSDEVVKLMKESPDMVKNIQDLNDIVDGKEMPLYLKIENVVEVGSKDYEYKLDTQLKIVKLMKEVVDELYVSELTSSELYELLIKSDLGFDGGELLLIMSDYIEGGMFDTDNLYDLTKELGFE